MTGLVIAAAIHVEGPIGALAPAMAVLALILLRFPGVAMALLLAGVVLIESEDAGLLPPFNPFYTVVGGSLTPPDVLLFIGLGGVLLRFVIEGERPQLPKPLVLPLTLLGLAIAVGVIGGYFAHPPVSKGELFHRGLNASYLILVPILVVNVVRDTAALRTFMVVVAALGSFKGLSGGFAAMAGVGADLGEETVSFFQPLSNLVMLAFVLGVVAALIRRIRMPTWMLAGAPIALLALALSYRRSFWIAAVFTLAVVAIIASRRRGRVVMALGGTILALTLAAGFTVGSSDNPSASPLAERAQTLTPSGLGTNRGDRYRLDERRNVIANVREHPLTGIGLGVPWKVHYPLAEDHDRRYAHFAALWYWLALGPLGLLAYLALMGTGLGTAVGIWRRHLDPVVQVGAIACFGAILALIVVELTATFTGVEPRLSIALGGGLGWLAAAWADLPEK